VPGFAARRQKGKAVAYVLKYRTQDGRQRWLTIGRHGAPWTPEEAREEARRVLGEVAQGRDPAGDKRAKRQAATVAELCDAYLADAEAGRLLTRRKTAKKPSTLRTDRNRIARHVKPRLGALPVPAVTREDIEDFMHDLADSKGGASRTVGLVGALFGYAVKHRMRSDNPARGIERPADGRRERRLSDDEYAALGNALRQASAADMWPPAVAAVRFVALSGWRAGEAVGLRWAEIDLARRTATLGDTKTGRSVRPLSHAACDVLRSLATRASDGALVFAATRGGGGMAALSKPWLKIAKLGGLPSDVTPHVLRHSFASLAGDLGYSEPTIAAMIGHKGHSITSRYIHSADTVLLAAADAVADRTLELMGEAKAFGSIVELGRARAS
jgi:integrase